jgi:hypothetical protein
MVKSMAGFAPARDGPKMKRTAKQQRIERENPLLITKTLLISLMEIFPVVQQKF